MEYGTITFDMKTTHIDTPMVFKKRITKSTPYTVMWWTELLTHSVTRYTSSMERLQWKDASRYLKLTQWIWKRLEHRIEHITHQQRLECGYTYAKYTHDSNSYTFQGHPIKNWVRDKIENTKLTNLK
jgi:hypothetical protein